MADQLASDTEIEELVADLSWPDGGDVSAVEALLTHYPDDPRLHFMLGSVLINGQSDYIKAHAALSRAIELAPEYALARYQLGFFELTSGEADRALATWGPLLNAPSDNYLRVFVEGMTHVIRDEFAEAIAKFERGIKLNTDNAPMNGDIQLLMQELRSKMDGAASVSQQDEPDKATAETSATSLLLGQLGGEQTRH
ncbi:MAG: hypothetical protein AAGI28_11505 [Pseudomonadota bacterium]